MVRSCCIGAMLTAVVASLAGSLGAQGTPRTHCSEGTVGSATVQGRMIDDAGAPVADRGVGLEEASGAASCATSTDSAGRFAFQQLPAGSYQLSFGSLGLARMAPLAFELAEGGTVALEIPTVRENAIEECARLTHCVTIISQLTEAEWRGDDARSLEALALRVSLAIAGETWEELQWVACIDAVPSLLDELRPLHADVVPSDECRARDVAAQSVSPRGRVEHIPTGRPARIIHAPAIGVRSRSEVTFSISYTVASLWGAGYDCTAVRVGERWVPRSCTMTWVS